MATVSEVRDEIWEVVEAMIPPSCRTNSAVYASAGSAPQLHEAFMHLACAFICQRFLRAL